MLWWVAAGSGVLVFGLEGPSRLLEQRGVVVDASVTHRRSTESEARGLRHTDHWLFVFTDTLGVERRVRVERDAGEAYLNVASLRFDPRSLTRRIRAGCAAPWPPQWWPMGDMEARCTLEGIRLRYYPRDVNVLDLPGFPPRRFASDPVRGWTETGVAAAVLSLLVFVPLALGVRVFGMVLG
jgi:hypothetical protein